MERRVYWAKYQDGQEPFRLSLLRERGCSSWQRMDTVWRRQAPYVISIVAIANLAKNNVKLWEWRSIGLPNFSNIR